MSNEKNILGRVVNKEKASKVSMTMSLVSLAALLALTGGCSKKNEKTNVENINSQVISTPSTDTNLTVRNNAGQEVELTTKNNSLNIQRLSSRATNALAPTFVFTDVNDDEQVRKQAEVILNKIQPMLKSENDEYLTFIATRENIEDMICVLNGRMPINSEYNDDTLNQMIQFNADIFANVGHVDNTLYNLEYADFFEEGSLEKAIAKGYDEVYAKIAEYRQEDNIDGFIEQAGFLANKLWNQYYLAGLNGGFNPYAVEESKQYLLFLAATSRINNFVWEYIENIRLTDPEFTICIPTCYNLNGEQVLRSFEEIELGLYTGKSFTDEVICRRDNNIFVPAADAYYKLTDSLSRNKNAVKVL